MCSIAASVTGTDDRRRCAYHRRPPPLCSAWSGILHVVRRIGDFVIDRVTSSRGPTLASNIESPDFRGSSLAGAPLFRGVMLACSSSHALPWHHACDYSSHSIAWLNACDNPLNYPVPRHHACVFFESPCSVVSRVRRS